MKHSKGNDCNDRTSERTKKAEKEIRSVSGIEVIREEKLLNSRMIHKLSQNRKGVRGTVAAS